MIILYYIKEKQLKIANEKDAINDLYYLDAEIPTVTKIQNYLNNDKNKNNTIITFFKSKPPQNIIENIKNNLSKINNKIPLYDKINNNLFLINKDDVYSFVIREHFRFPDEKIMNTIKKEYNKYKDKLSKDILVIRNIRKLKYMIHFMKSFNITILYNSYIISFYESNDIGKNITTCIRPSYKSHFLHIKPFYNKDEIVHLSYNMEIIRPIEGKIINNEDISKLCNILKRNDISSKVIMSHQNYIRDKNLIGLIQYYSAQGSYFINNYLRDDNKYSYKNEFLETFITSIWGLVNTAPAFDKSYIVYRFIKNDKHLSQLNIGESYIEKGFTSTTRNPFYRSDIYKFGFILLKIKIPALKKGTALCIETVSHFPFEEELILPPMTKFKLIKKDENVPYYHIDYEFGSNIKTRYEFVIDYENKIKPSYIATINKTIVVKKNPIDFLKIEKTKSKSLIEKIKYFVNNYINQLFQFEILLGKLQFTAIIEWYDSTGIYKNIYASTQKNGFSMYTLCDNHMLFLIEFIEEKSVSVMYVNYFLKYTSMSKNKKVYCFELSDFLYLISSIAFHFDIDNIYLYSRYKLCDFKESQVEKKGGNYCVDFYKYLKFKKKIHDGTNVTLNELQTKFSYFLLDNLRNISPSVILIKNIRDDIIYQIYNKIYKNTKEKDNLASFYVWMVEKYCYLISNLNDKIEKNIWKDDMFNKDYYEFKALLYLYNREYISYLPSGDISNIQYYPKNYYRTDIDRNQRVPEI
jgi:hypothetical protein